MTVTVFPPRPAFSTRIRATTRTGTGSSRRPDVLHLQSVAGHPHTGHVRPLPVEYTVRAFLSLNGALLVDPSMRSCR